MASKEVEVLDPAAPVEKDKEIASQAALNRRYFMAALGVAGAAAGAAILSGPSVVHAQQPIPSGYNQLDIVNFLLNIQYLKATIYSYLCSGNDLPAASGVLQGSGGVFNQMTKFTFSGLVNNAQTIDLFNEMYYDELNSLIALRSLNATAAARPTMNLFGTGTSTTTATTPSVNQAIAIARFLEDVSVQAFAYASEYLSGQNLAYVMQTLAVNGFHAGALRLICIQNGIPYLSPQDMTSTSTSGGQTVNSFTGGTLLGSSTFFAALPVATATTPSPVVVGSAISGVGIPEGTVISAVTPALVYTGTINGSATVPTNQITSVTPLTGLAVGQVISGTGIPANSTIKSISGSTITLNFTVAIPSTGVGFDASGNPTSTSPLSGGIVTAATGVVLTVGFAAIATKTTTLNTVSSVAGLSVGQPISGTNIPANATITAIGPGSNITISAAASGSSTVAPTGIVSKGSNLVTQVSSVNGIAIGQPITGTGIAANTTVTNFDPVALTITMSAAATATSSVAPKGVLVSGSNTVTAVSSLSGLVSGLPVSGTGIPANAYILGVGNTNTFTMQLGSTTTPPVFTTPPTPANVLPNSSTSTTPVLTTAGVLTAGSSIVTNVASVSGIGSGVPITGANILPGTTITAVSAVTAAQPWTITLSAPVTNATAVTVTASPTGVVTASSPYITQLSSFAGISVGNAILGSNIPIGANVGSINSATTITFIGTWASGSATINSVSSTLGLAVGQPITGTGIPAGTTILTVGNNTITLSANATAASNPAYAGVLVATVTSSTTFVPNSIAMTTAAGGSIATETITFTTIQTMSTLPQTTITVTGATETVTIPTIQTVNPALGSVTLSNNAIATGGATLTVVTADAQDVEPDDPGTVSFSGIVTSGSMAVTSVSSLTGLAVGLLVNGPNIPAGTTIATVVTPATITLSAAATGGATAPQQLVAYLANSAALALAGPSVVAGSSPTVYQGFFNTASSGTASANTPAGFTAPRTFSQVLAALYGSTLPSTYQGGFFPNGVSGSINVV